MAAFNIDDAQTTHTKRKIVVGEVSFVIGAAMHHRGRHTPHDRSRVSRSGPVNYSADATHDLRISDFEFRIADFCLSAGSVFLVCLW